ncbi:phage major capsid protein [Paraburkholderia acidipaludis]|uniref:phage major capsid protein n=1 Tax=Paraburkholderia acidipaludis TaxID=660537 RepID=UPI000485C519|nr:phage major capsid protein [Paraburkholderia acidipaludis]
MPITIEEVRAALAERDAGVEALLTKANADIAALAEKVNGQNVNILDLGQKFAGLSEHGFSRGASGAGRASLGALLAKSDLLTRWNHGNGPKSVRVALEGVNIKADTITSSGFPVQPQQELVQPIVLPRFWNSLFSLPITTDSIQTVDGDLENNAAPQQGEGALKAQSSTTFTPTLWPAQTIAHWQLASRQVLDDVGALGEFMDLSMREGLQAAVDQQVITGSGTGYDLKGVMTGGTQMDGTSATALDSIIMAVANLQSQGATRVVCGLSPLDIAAMRIAKSSGSGTYLLDPLASLNGVPGAVFVPVAAIPQGQYCAVATPQGAYIGLRQGVTVEVSREDRDNFVKNLVTVLVECRLALVLQRPSMCLYGALVAPAGTGSTKAKA